MKIKRTILDKLKEEIARPYISILIGARQVGKSFLMRELEAECRKRKLRAKYFNLEDPADLGLLTGTDEEVLDLLENSGKVIFIDEFHYLKNATRIFKAIYDSKKKIKIFASGSSSIEIHKHLKESLAGRYRSTPVHPLFVKELAQARGYRAVDYFRYGGMPGLIHESKPEDKMNLLKNVVQTYLLKDIKGLIKEENIRAFNHLLYLIAQNQGSLTPVAGLAREIRLSEPAVLHHLELMAHTYVCFPLESYAVNQANELKKSKKYYLYDLGIRNSLLNDFSKLEDRDDKGALLESFVCLSLLKQLKSNMELRFWRTRQGDEVDFILVKNRIPYPIEVKYSTDLKIPEGMKKFLSRYKRAPGGMVVSKNTVGEIQYEGKPIRFVAWQSAEAIPYLQSV